MAESGINTPLVRQAFEHRERYEYKKNKIPVGEIWNGEVFMMKVKDTIRGLIVGGSGDGKTFLEARIRDAFLQADKNNRCMVISDIKNEYHTMWKPVQSSYKRFLMKTEVPKGTPCKVYYPVFLHKQIPNEKQTKTQFHLNSLSTSEVIQFTGEKIPTTTLACLEKMMAMTLMEQSVDMTIIKEKLRKINYPDASKRKVMAIMETLIRNGIIGNKYYYPDFVKDLNEGKVPVLNTFGLEGLSPEYKNYLYVMMSKIMKDVWEAKMTGKLKRKTHLLEVNEEANITLQAEMNTPFKAAQINYTARGRQHKVSTLTLAQTWRGLDENILNNVDWIIFSASMKTEEAIQLLLEYAPEYAQQAQYRAKMRQFMAQARKIGRWTKIYINRKSQERVAFRPYAPLSYVLEEGS